MRFPNAMTLWCVTVLSCAGLWGAAGGPAFEVASVKPAAVSAAGLKESEPEKIAVTPKGVTMRNVTLRNCLRWAYSVRDSQISGPAWLGVQRYDIVAGTSAPTEQQELRMMLRELLEQRFRLVLHREQKELPVYDMVRGKKGVRLQSAGSTGGQAEIVPEGGALVFRNYSMAELADRLESRPFRLDRPVVDRTELAGTFDFKIRIAPDMAGMKQSLEGMELGNAEQPGMITLLQEQLGLTFRPVRTPVESIRVDSAEKVPTEN